MATTPTALDDRARLQRRHGKVHHLLLTLNERADALLSSGRDVPPEMTRAIRHLERERLDVERRIDDAYL